MWLFFFFLTIVFKQKFFGEAELVAATLFLSLSLNLVNFRERFNLFLSDFSDIILIKMLIEKKLETQISCRQLDNFPLLHNFVLEEGHFHGKTCKGHNFRLVLIHHLLPFRD